MMYATDASIVSSSVERLTKIMPGDHRSSSVQRIWADSRVPGGEDMDLPQMRAPRTYVNEVGAHLNPTLIGRHSSGAEVCTGSHFSVLWWP